MVEEVVFVIAGACCLLGALGVIWPAQNPVHAALSLVGSLFAMAVLFIAQGAYFLAAIQVIVYAGAIVVLFLFVIMLLGVDEVEPSYVNRTWLTGAGVLAAVSVLLLTGVVAVRGGQGVVEADASTATDIDQIGRLLFTDYVYVFEITGVLLTIAVVGAVMLSRRAIGPEWDDDYPEPEGDAAVRVPVMAAADLAQADGGTDDSVDEAGAVDVATTEDEA